MAESGDAQWRPMMSAVSSRNTGDHASGTTKSAQQQARRPSAQLTLQDRIRSAAAVVVGTVREVRPLTGRVLQSSARGIGISEHNPGIAEAVITVTEAIKGAKSGDQVVVRFPTSEDVMWYRYPKFAPGTSGVFILHPDSLTGGAEAELGSDRAQVFTVPQRSDVLPAEEGDRVRDAARQSSE
jgi:hypothetical protein